MGMGVSDAGPWLPRIGVERWLAIAEEETGACAGEVVAGRTNEVSALGGYELGGGEEPRGPSLLPITDGDGKVEKDERELRPGDGVVWAPGDAVARLPCRENGRREEKLRRAGGGELTGVLTGAREASRRLGMDVAGSCRAGGEASGFLRSAGTSTGRSGVKNEFSSSVRCVAMRRLRRNSRSSTSGALGRFEGSCSHICWTSSLNSFCSKFSGNSGRPPAITCPATSNGMFSKGMREVTISQNTQPSE